MQRMTYVKYKCAQCGAEDTDKLFPGERPLPCLNCWKCHSGMSIKNLQEQVMTGEGMFPVKPLPSVA